MTRPERGKVLITAGKTVFYNWTPTQPPPTYPQSSSSSSPPPPTTELQMYVGQFVQEQDNNYTTSRLRFVSFIQFIVYSSKCWWFIKTAVQISTKIKWFQSLYLQNQSQLILISLIFSIFHQDRTVRKLKLTPAKWSVINNEKNSAN